MAQALRSTIDKWDLVKLQSFCKAKDTVNRTKWQRTDWERIFTKHISDRGLISKIHNEVKKLVSQKTSPQLPKWGAELKGEFSTKQSPGQEVLKEMLNLLSHQGNANQNDPDLNLIPLTVAKIKMSIDSTCW